MWMKLGARIGATMPLDAPAFHFATFMDSRAATSKARM
jgi:hypothetical protein